MGFEGIGEGKKTQGWSLLLGTWLVHSLAHELAASPEATKGGKLSTKLCPLLYRDCYELTK
jgi:hypothetical protein